MNQPTAEDRPHPLTGAQRRRLRGLAHSLKPVVRVGQQGLTDGVWKEMERALDSHELIKIQLPGDKAEKKALMAEIDERMASQSAGLIGHIAIFYRRHREPDKRSIRL
ncbi:MAG: YhbY family RNA-binding protein [Acidobacteriota bacterium]